MAASGGSPRILAILCSWHPLTAADNAGMDGRSYGTSTTILPVDCAGVVSAASILRAFSERADGVLVAACGRGDCHYVNGNESCEKVVEETRELMRLAGVTPERLRFDLSSDVDGARFVDLVEEFTAEVAKLNGRVKRKPARKKPARKAAKAAAKKVAKKPAKKQTRKTVKKAARKPAKAAKKPAKAAKKAAKKPAKKQTRKTVKKQTRKTVKKAAKKPAKRPAGKTAKRSGRKR